jgi:GDP-L-fucose synthase
VDKDSRIFVAGHRGLVGSAIRRGLEQRGFSRLLLRNRQELDLFDEAAVDLFFAREQPEYVFLAAARVGGILANDTYPVEFLNENLRIQSNVIQASYRSGVKRLLFLGSSCIYPQMAPQPMREESLLTGPLEPTNRAYALAKITGIEMCWAYNRQYGTRFLAAMPTNVYGPNDNFDLSTSHVVPALIRKMAVARNAGEKSVTIWGTGSPRREFLFSEDLADASIFLMNLPDSEYASLLRPDVPPILNIGCGEDLSIRELAEIVARVVGFDGKLVFDTSRPEGAPRKLLDVSRMRALGWEATTSLEKGLRITLASIAADWARAAV